MAERTLAEKMLDFRALHNLTQEELAQACGLNKMTINFIENGKQKPSAMSRRKIELVIQTDEQ